IGEKTIVELLKEFKSVKRISTAKFDALKEVIGTSKAHKIFDYYHNK
ncbi:MAG: hypothetical protein KJP20_11440, partial [Bacteroidia bacterium]|nr:hypothetical protein [Bacteroidia bacterium]